MGPRASGMRKAACRLLIIPPNLGYGAAGAGSAVPLMRPFCSQDLIQIVNVSVPAPSVSAVGTNLEVEDLLVGDGEAWNQVTRFLSTTCVRGWNCV